jgi:hypothetical protein
MDSLLAAGAHTVLSALSHTPLTFVVSSAPPPPPPLRALHFLVGLVAAFSTRVAHPRSSCPLAEGGGGGGAGGGECGLMCGARVSKCFSFGRLHWWKLVAPQCRVSGLVLVPTAVCL